MILHFPVAIVSTTKKKGRRMGWGRRLEKKGLQERYCYPAPLVLLIGSWATGMVTARTDRQEKLLIKWGWLRSSAFLSLS